MDNNINSVNINPLASGNKTSSGLIGIVLTSIIYAVLKHFGIADDSGSITTVIVGAIISGGLTIVGIVHKAIKAGKKS